MAKHKGPKVLVFDIETAPMVASVWALFDQNIGLNMVEKDWHVLSFCAKWLGDPASKVIYKDQRGVKNIEDDSKLLKEIWKLLDEADVTITQNGDKFDIKKLNARFALAGMKPPSPFKSIDTCKIARRKFGFTSNKLEYLTDKLCTKYKKLKHKKFPGFELWKQALANNPEAWDEMEKYNTWDVLSLEELYGVLAPWDTTVNFSLYTDEENPRCNCGSTDFKKRGFNYAFASKTQRYQCSDCGAWSSSKTNLFTKAKRASLRKRL